MLSCHSLASDADFLAILRLLCEAGPQLTPQLYGDGSELELSQTLDCTAREAALNGRRTTLRWARRNPQARGRISVPTPENRRGHGRVEARADAESAAVPHLVRFLQAACDGLHADFRL